MYQSVWHTTDGLGARPPAQGLRTTACDCHTAQIMDEHAVRQRTHVRVRGQPQSLRGKHPRIAATQPTAETSLVTAAKLRQIERVLLSIRVFSSALRRHPVVVRTKDDFPEYFQIGGVRPVCGWM